MKYRCMTIICCALALCAVSGCRLATESGSADAHEDRLAGVFITAEYLDLFDFEAYLNDNLNGLNGGGILAGGDAEQYQGRIYAVLKPKTLISEDTGETTITHEYVFEGVEGIPFFIAAVQAGDEENSYIATKSDAAISDGHTALNYGDNQNSVTLEGTLYVTPPAGHNVYYINPVYQSADGGVYAVSGDGITFSNASGDSEGAVFSTALDAVTTVTENGKTRTDSISVKISISVMPAPEKIVILQMDSESALVSRAEYAPDAVPVSFTPEINTAYLIAETHTRDGAGNVKISRAIYGKDAENIETFRARADGICVKQWTQIIWKPV